MPCYHPIPTRREDIGAWTLNPQLGTADTEIPCGTCLACRTDRAMDYTNRAIHEASLWQHNTFVHLTYDDEHLPRELIPDHLTKFLKRLRRKCSRDYATILSDRSSSIRYLACGEYGESTERPHYHACLFNLAFDDLRQWDKRLYVSATLDAIWGQGAAKLRPFTADAAGYVANYITKFGRQTYADEYGEERHPPFKRQSLKPALGKDWLDKHHAELGHGYTVIDGKKTRMPRYYQKKINQTWEATKERLRTAQHLGDTRAQPPQATDKKDPERVKAAEKIHRQQANEKTRRQI